MSAASAAAAAPAAARVTAACRTSASPPSVEAMVPAPSGGPSRRETGVPATVQSDRLLDQVRSATAGLATVERARLPCV
jgi:hypothetical protein